MSLDEYLNKHYAQRSARSYKREILNYLSNNPKARQATYQEITDYLGALRKRYGNAATLNRIVYSIKAYYDFLFFIGERIDNPARAIKLRDRRSNDVQLQDLFTNEELESLLNTKERYYSLELRNKALMSILVYQALLPSEIEQLKLSDIELERGTLYSKGTHKTNARELQLKTTQIMLLHQYIQQSRPRFLRGKQSESLILGHRGAAMSGEDITKHVKRVYKNKFEKRQVTPLTIRQSVITNLLKAGNDLRIVQVFAGHMKPSTTEKYRQSNLDELKNAVHLHHPFR